MKTLTNKIVDKVLDKVLEEYYVQGERKFPLYIWSDLRYDFDKKIKYQVDDEVDLVVWMHIEEL